jgi:K+-sensing histidine kinase KdpD
MKLERLTENSVMEEENARLRGDLLTVASRISHDLRTPLGGIVTSAEVLREMLAEVERPETLTKAILDSVDDMTRLIRQVSFVTRATAQPLPPKRVNMVHIFALARQRTERLVTRRGATISEPPSWPEVNGVADWLEYVWASLLTNALQHTPEKVRIELTWREENGQCRFGVADNGGGVREDLRPTLFCPFHLLHKPEGTRGLGLSIVQRLMELQGGNCGYEPLPGGSLFYFSLPTAWSR